MSASTASAPNLATLLEQSRKLQGKTRGGRDIPSVELGLDQIESASRRLGAGAGLSSISQNGGYGQLSGRRGMAIDGEQEGGQYLLAHGNVDFPLVSRTLNTLDPASAFAPLQPLNDTDIEGHLRHAHEQTIISAIEDTRRATINNFYMTLERNMHKEWERQKEQVFEELGRHSTLSLAEASGSAASSSAALTSSASAAGLRRSLGGRGDDGRQQYSQQAQSSGSQLQMHNRMMKYDRTTKRLNEQRKQGFAFAIVSAYAEASTVQGAASVGDARITQLADTWRLLGHLVRERDVVNGEFRRDVVSERQYASVYLSPDQDSGDAKELRRMITSGALQFLEEQFMNHVEKTLQARPAEANLGGVPTVQNKIRAYINVKYSKQGQWTATNLEMANNQPLWARIFLLLRAGHHEEALNFANENEAQLTRLERNFLSYFKAWLDSPERRLPKQMRDRFLSEYNQRIRHITDNQGDPFKHALYKLIGRTEISRRNVPGVTNTTEDWLWMQLMLVRDRSDGSLASEPSHERFTLRDLAKVLVKFGEAHFDPKGQRPLLYFQILLLSGQFERAVAYLYGSSLYQVDAVHFGIALAYYGLLRIPSPAETSDIDIFTSIAGDVASYEFGYLNFARMIYRYYRPFAHSDPVEALQYIYLLCLNADAPSPTGEQQVARCHDYIRELVTETRAYSELLGDVRHDGTKVPGQIEKDLQLIHLKNEKEYLSGIVKTAAKRADQEKRFADTILLYNLAEEYDSVIQVLNAALGASLSQPAGATSEASQANQSSSFGMADDLVSSAKSILEHYDRSAIVLHRISKKARETCQTLLRLKEALGLFEQNRLEDALNTIEGLNIIPLDGDLASIIRRAEDVKQLDDAILRNLDTILLTTMHILYKIHTQLKESPYGDPSRQHKMGEARKRARALMMFAGMLRYRLSSETYATLTRWDVYLH